MNDINEIRQIITESGNSFHCRVVTYLRSKGWHVLVSPYYMDNISDKPREIDLIAEKTFAYGNGMNILGNVHVKLFIECKYIPQKVVFWFDDKNMIATKECVVRNIPLRKNNTRLEMHHYIKNTNPVAKLFGSKQNKSSESEVMYKALNQSLNAMVNGHNSGSIIQCNERSLPSKFIEYPVILCNSFENFYKVGISSQHDPKKIEENFQMEVNYAYFNHNKTQVNEFFLIDVIDFNKIDEFLNEIENDADEVKSMLSS